MGKARNNKDTRRVLPLQHDARLCLLCHLVVNRVDYFTFGREVVHRQCYMDMRNDK
jgi:hypothetical protein